MKTTTKSLLRSVISITLTLSALAIHAQTKLNGPYIATKISYLSDDELPEGNILKYTYIKYTFNNSGQIGISGVYYEMGTPYLFAIRGKHLIVKSEAGAVINTMKIMESTPDKLVLIASAANGSLEDPWAIKYTLYNEQFIQKSLRLSPDDIFSIKGADLFINPDKKFMLSSKDHLFSSICMTARNMWQPAQHNGKAVKVLMNQELKYLTSEQTLPSYFNSQKANAAYNNQDYELALYYYDKVLEVKPDEMENLYRRGICKQALGNLKGACADWTKIQLTGNKTANELLLKYCK